MYAALSSTLYTRKRKESTLTYASQHTTYSLLISICFASCVSLLNSGGTASQCDYNQNAIAYVPMKQTTSKLVGKFRKWIPLLIYPILFFQLVGTTKFNQNGAFSKNDSNSNILTRYCRTKRVLWSLVGKEPSKPSMRLYYSCSESFYLIQHAFLQ